MQTARRLTRRRHVIGVAARQPSACRGKPLRASARILGGRAGSGKSRSWAVGTARPEKSARRRPPIFPPGRRFSVTDAVSRECAQAHGGRLPRAQGRAVPSAACGWAADMAVSVRGAVLAELEEGVPGHSFSWQQEIGSPLQPPPLQPLRTAAHERPSACAAGRIGGRARRPPRSIPAALPWAVLPPLRGWRGGSSLSSA